MSRDTARSLPGIGRAESTTVSPGPADTSRCSPRLSIDSAESGSPWLPETNTTARWSLSTWPGESRRLSAMRSAPRSSATSALSTMRRPRNATGRPCRSATSATRCMRGIDVAKQERKTRPRVRCMTSSNAGTSESSSGVKPACSTLVLSERRARTPRSPQAESASRSVRSSSGASGSILKSPLATTTPAGVSIASAKLSETLWATRIGWTRNGPSSTVSPGRIVRRSAWAPRSARRRRAKPSVSGLPYTGAGAAVSAYDSAPMWSSWPWVSRIPRTRSRRAARYSKSGTMKSTPGMSAGGKSIPASRSRRSSSHSITIAFRPNSPSPPSGTSLMGAEPPASPEINPEPPEPGLKEPAKAPANSTTDSVSALRDPSTLRDLKYSLRRG